MKNHRILKLYDKLLNNEEINLDRIAQEENISKRTIERDIADIKNHLVLQGEGKEFFFDKKIKKYTLTNNNNDKFTKSEALAISKILLHSRAFLKNEMYILVDKLLKQCTLKEDYKELEAMIKNEKFLYMELTNKRSFIADLYTYGKAIQNKNKMKIRYIKTNKELVERIIQPVGLMFSEFYFYLLGHIENIDKKEHFENKDDIFPTIYRVDRILKFEVLKEKFTNIYYNNRFQEGKFRKQIHLMTGGKLRKVEFFYKGTSIEAVLDKIPTAKIMKKSEQGYWIAAEVFGNGFDRWLKILGDEVEITKS
ncbi:helix-turn-helix transcriptional regulator [Fusobacterium necrophorum]|uniref:helix-turn-helix transcriptional regulator n=1 Tax=Fusobacterium necrophorum TaxID=859 RepID=UPI003A5F7892